MTSLADRMYPAKAATFLQTAPAPSAKSETASDRDGLARRMYPANALASELQLDAHDAGLLVNRSQQVRREGLTPEQQAEQCVERFNDRFGQFAKRAYRTVNDSITADVAEGLHRIGVANDYRVAEMLYQRTQVEK